MKKLIIFDVMFYLILPYLIWNYGKGYLGDYYAMLLSTVPGFLYTIFRFFVERQFNVTGLFLIGTLFVGTLIDLLSGSAEAMLINGVYYTYALALLFLVTILINRPLMIYFFIDAAYLMGYDRKDSLRFYRRKELFPYFLLLTGLLAIRNLTKASVKLWLIHQFGVEGYGKMIIVMQVLSWCFTILISAATFYVIHKINQLAKQESNSQHPISISSD